MAERFNFDAFLAHVDQVLEEPLPSIIDALHHAVERKRMTQEEANECIAGYLRGYSGADQQ